MGSLISRSEKGLQEIGFLTWPHSCRAQVVGSAEDLDGLYEDDDRLVQRCMP